jgi:hypothetical protein
MPYGFLFLSMVFSPRSRIITWVVWVWSFVAVVSNFPHKKTGRKKEKNHVTLDICPLPKSLKNESDRVFVDG